MLDVEKTKEWNESVESMVPDRSASGVREHITYGACLPTASIPAMHNISL